MFIADLFILAKKQKQSKCQSVDEWINLEIKSSELLIEVKLYNLNEGVFDMVKNYL